MHKNYYLVLGVTRDCSQRQIKHAYRRIAKQLHPDASCIAPNTERFLELQQAYETLADAEKRRRYDDELDRRGSSRGLRRSPTPPSAAWSAGGAFRASDPWPVGVVEPLLPLGVDRPRDPPGGREVTLEVVLSPQEALEGGLFPIELPWVQPCPRCSQADPFEAIPCSVCGGSGGRITERECYLSIPPRTAHGTTVTLGLEGIGIRGARLHVRVAVDPILAWE
jgi:molecular chaperone DnaJ